MHALLRNLDYLKTAKAQFSFLSNVHVVPLEPDAVFKYVSV